MPLDFPDRYPETLQLVAQAVYEYLISANLAKHQQAAEAAFRTAEHVRNKIGGGKVYIQKGAYYDADQRAHEIFKRFNGRNGAELAREYDLTEERIRKICSELTRAAQQGKLPL